MVSDVKGMMMKAYCGLDCARCDAFVATAKNDDALREKVAEKWSKDYHASITPDQINCTGCKSEGVKFMYCENMCEIRKCAVGRSLEACTDCAEYACSKLDFILKGIEASKEKPESTGKKKKSRKKGGSAKKSKR